MTFIERSAARVLLIDGAGRALLLRGGDPARPGLRWWFTPGGGMQAGETRAQAAARELFEETGLRVHPEALGVPIWHQLAEFSFDQVAYRQDQEFFLHRVSQWQVDTAGFETMERLTIDEHRWWSVEELEATDETVYPVELPSLLRRYHVERGGEPAVGVPRGLSC